MKRIYNMQMCSLIFMKCYLLTQTIISKRKWNNINFRIQRMIIRFYLISLSSITDITMISEILFSVIGMVIFFILECYFKNQIHWHKDFNSFILDSLSNLFYFCSKFFFGDTRNNTIKSNLFDLNTYLCRHISDQIIEWRLNSTNETYVSSLALNQPSEEKLRYLALQLLAIQGEIIKLHYWYICPLSV